MSNAITNKSYACKRCGHVTQQSTNHYGETYNWGRVSACPKCPPYASHSFGGSTTWVCLEFVSAHRDQTVA